MTCAWSLYHSTQFRDVDMLLSLHTAYFVGAPVYDVLYLGSGGKLDFSMSWA